MTEDLALPAQNLQGDLAPEQMLNGQKDGGYLSFLGTRSAVDLDETLNDSESEDEWQKAYAETKKRRNILRRLIIDCSA